MGSAGATDIFGGVDIGGTKLHAIVARADGAVIGRARKKTKAKRGVDEVMARVRKCLDEACEAAGAERGALSAVGVGAPSPVRADGTAVNAPNLGWRDYPVAEVLSRLLERPVVAENDCNLGTLGEHLYGAGRGADMVVGLFMGTGLGGGIVHRGEMLRGRNRLAAELGHMVVEARGRKCGCGHTGCLEAYASKTGMGRRFIEEIIKKKRDSAVASDDPDDLRNVRSGALARAYRGGDEVVREVVREASWYLGVGVANVMSILGPEVVVLGGGVFEALGQDLIEVVRESARAAAFPPSAFGDARIRVGELGDDAVALGAVAYAREQLAAGALAS